MTSKCCVSFWAVFLTWRATFPCKNIHKLLASKLAHKQHKTGQIAGLQPGVQHGREACHGLPVVGSVLADFQGLKTCIHELTLDLIGLVETSRDGPPSSIKVTKSPNPLPGTPITEQVTLVSNSSGNLKNIRSNQQLNGKIRSSA